MERVETLLKKLQEQFEQQAPAASLLLTVQMLQAELLHLQTTNPGVLPGNPVTITISGNNTPEYPAPENKDMHPPVEEEKIIEVLQVDEAELEAELEEIKRNAEVMQQISVHNKPAIVFETDDEVDDIIPTLAHLRPSESKPENKIKKETIVIHTPTVNEKLKQSKIDLGDTLAEPPVRDLRKAIGVNDRYLFINELFRGDEVSYERSIKTINSFSILPEAEYWISRELKLKNGWKDNDAVVKQFDQLVRRRFS
ncbi:MAG: hypothetical protein NTX08_05200 [Sphingobacteriales bacterium]|nr:hypothetical protein [Sphingobacteriales bacterium]